MALEGVEVLLRYAKIVQCVKMVSLNCGQCLFVGLGFLAKNHKGSCFSRGAACFASSLLQVLVWVLFGVR